MFKDLKIIKLVVIASFFVYIIQSSFSAFKIYNNFLSTGSIGTNDSITLFVASNYSEQDKAVSIKDLYGNAIQGVNIDLKQNYVLNTENDVMTIGYPTDQQFSINLDNEVRSGIYTIDDASFVVKSKEKADITVVFPFINNHFYYRSDNLSFFNKKTTHLSLNRSVPVDKYTAGMVDQFAYLDSAYSTNYITDLDLENAGNFNDSKLLIIYGSSSLWTKKMRENLLTYFRSGGNVLLITSKTLYAKLWVNEDDNRARTVMKDIELDKQMVETWAIKLEDSPFVNTGLTSKYGGVAEDISATGYKVLKPDHPILSGIETDSVPIDGKLFMGTLIQWNNDVPIVGDFSIFQNRKLSRLKVEILAFSRCKGLYENSNSGIFVVKQDSTSGKIVALGTEDWCLKKNQDKAEIKKITRNAVSYLLGKN